MKCQRCNAIQHRVWFPVGDEPKPEVPHSQVVERVALAGESAVLCLECANEIDIALSSSPQWRDYVLANATLGKSPSTEAADEFIRASVVVRNLSRSLIAAKEIPGNV